MLRIFPWRCGLNYLTVHAGFKTHKLAPYVSTGLSKIVENFRIAPKFHAYITQNFIGVFLDQAQAFLG